MPCTDSRAFRDIFLKLLCSNKILGKKSSSLEGWSRYIIVHDPVCFMSQERVPSGLSRQAKLMSGLRFQLDKWKKLFLVLSAELGRFYGEELNLMVKILLLWLQVGMAFRKFLILCMGIGFETQMLSLWDGDCPGRGWKPGGELKAICPSCLKRETSSQRLHSFAQEERQRNASKSPSYLSCSTIPATRRETKPCPHCLLTVRRFEASTSIIPRKRFWQSGGIKWGMWNTPRFTFSSSCRKLSSSKGRAPCKDGTEPSVGENWRGPKEESQDKHGERIEKGKSAHNELL